MSAMPTTGAYEFKRALKSVNGMVLSEYEISVGEWAWLDRGMEEEPKRRYILLTRCPDCRMEQTLWFQGKGHQVDAQGNIHPSVSHSWVYAGVEKCGFHTQPTKLLDFVDRR